MNSNGNLNRSFERDQIFRGTNDTYCHFPSVARTSTLWNTTLIAATDALASIAALSLAVLLIVALMNF